MTRNERVTELLAHRWPVLVLPPPQVRHGTLKGDGYVHVFRSWREGAYVVALCGFAGFPTVSTAPADCWQCSRIAP